MNMLVIRKAKKPRGFAKVLSMPVTYVSNTKAWMTRDIFSKWLADFEGDGQGEVQGAAVIE